MNGSASAVLVKPFVVMAARVLGPGPTRLRLVKLAHKLSPGRAIAGLGHGPQNAEQEPAAQPTGRAA
jgi:hypothetical protein